MIRRDKEYYLNNIIKEIKNNQFKAYQRKYNKDIKDFEIILLKHPVNINDVSFFKSNKYYISFYHHISIDYISLICDHTTILHKNIDGSSYGYYDLNDDESLYLKTLIYKKFKWILGKQK